MHNDKRFPEFRPWDKLVGVNEDLADVIVGVLSWLSNIHACHRISFSDFYRIFSQLSGEFPGIIPKFQYVRQSTGIGVFYQSKTLAEAIEASLQIGIAVSSDWQSLEVSRDTAVSNLKRLRNRVGQTFVGNLRPVAKQLAEMFQR